MPHGNKGRNEEEPLEDTRLVLASHRHSAYQERVWPPKAPGKRVMLQSADAKFKHGSE